MAWGEGSVQRRIHGPSLFRRRLDCTIRAPYLLLISSVLELLCLGNTQASSRNNSSTNRRIHEAHMRLEMGLATVCGWGLLGVGRG
jgi:hypothetical protein